MIREKAKYIKRKSQKASAYNRAVTQTNPAKIRIIGHMVSFVSRFRLNIITYNLLAMPQ